FSGAAGVPPLVLYLSPSHTDPSARTPPPGPPSAIVCAGMLLETTAPAPTMLPDPIRTPRKIVALPPIQTPSSMTTAANSRGSDLISFPLVAHPCLCDVTRTPADTNTPPPISSPPA